MSRTWNGATGNRAAVGSAVVTAAPITLAAWIRPTLINTTRCVLDAKNTVSGSSLDCFEILTLSSGAVMALTGAAAADSNSTTTDTMSINNWYHVGAVFASATSRIAYLGGVAATEETTSRVPAGINDFHVGVSLRSTSVYERAFVGDIGEAAVWSVALSPAEMALLAGGACPNTIQVANLVGFWHIFGDDSPELDSADSFDLTITGSLPKNDAVPGVCTASSSWKARRTVFSTNELIYGIPTSRAG